MRRKFYLDKRNGKFMGVCAGIADYFRIDATIVRIGAVVVTLMGAAPWTFILYVLAAWLAKPKPAAFDAEDDYRLPRTSVRDVQERMTDVDRRLAEVDNYMVHSNTSLAREIEELR